MAASSSQFAHVAAWEAGAGAGAGGSVVGWAVRIFLVGGGRDEEVAITRGWSALLASNFGAEDAPKNECNVPAEKRRFLRTAFACIPPCVFLIFEFE